MANSLYARMVNFVRRHRKAFFLIGLTVFSFFVANIGAALAFNQRVEIDGVRIETDREVYSLGDTVLIRLFLVNTQDHTISICVGTRDVILSNVFGGLIGITVFSDPCSPRVLQPGSETLVGEEIKLPLNSIPGQTQVRYLPGPYTIEAEVLTEDDTGYSFRGSINILVVIGPHL